METMYNLLVLGVITATLGQVTAQLSLSTTGGVQCYGEQVTLQCRHPVLPQEPEFLQTEVSWRRNGKGISAVGLGRTILNRRITQLVFTINDSTAGNYTCFLVNALGGPPRNSSKQIVKPLVPYPLNLTATSDTNRTILNWTLSRNPCGYNVSFNVSWKSTSGAGSGTTSEMSYTITSLQANPKYNVTVQVLMNIKGKTVFGGKMETMVSTNATNGTPSDNCTRVVPTPTHTTTNPGSNVNINPSGGSGGNRAAIAVPVSGGVLICLAVVAVLVAAGICWRKKNNKQLCPCRVQVTEQQPLLKECQLSDHYEAVNFEDGCPPPLECTMTGPLGKGEKIVNHSEDVFRTNLLNESLWDDDDSGYLCSLDPHNSKDSKSMLLQSVVCMTDEVDETKTLVFPIQETTEDGCCSLITGSSAPEEESLTDQHVPSQPEQPLLNFDHLPSSVTANEQDEEFTPEQESTPSMDEPTKFLSETVFLTSASPMITRPIRFPLDDIYAGDASDVGTDTFKLLASEGEIPRDGMELLNASNKVSAFRSSGTDNTVTVFNSQCTDAPACNKIFVFDPCLQDKEELPDLECTAPSDHTAENPIGKLSPGGELGITQSRFSKMVPGEGRICCPIQRRNKDRM